MLKEADWQQLRTTFSGEVHCDPLWRAMYATDASVYRERPLAVVFPRSVSDLQAIVGFCQNHALGLIPRGGGTSLAGQCVGPGVVVDLSRHFNQIKTVDTEEGWARVQAGVIRDQLNDHLGPSGWHFGPNTSTTNRCTLGGMAGNNSCGSTSIVYGTTRDKVLEVQAVLADGSLATFGPEEMPASGKHPGLQAQIRHRMHELLAPSATRKLIRDRFPHPDIHRRNSGYALDVLAQCQPFESAGPAFNLASLLCGSEGTLALIYSIKIKLDPLPPPQTALITAHFESVQEALQAVLVAQRHPLYACELMDKTILDCTKGNIRQQNNRFFLQGDPGAILLLELRAQASGKLESLGDHLIQDLQEAGLGYAFPILHPPQSERAWELRKAGLGVLSHLPAGKKAISCVEDTAVRLDDLPAYIADFTRLMEHHGQTAIYHAHAGAGELHLRPLLNLRDPRQLENFRRICVETAQLVKRYRGSLSGEHGDGRVRAPFLPTVLGEEVMDLLKRVKQIWDPNGLFNPGKIVAPPPADQNLRFHPQQSLPTIETVYDFSREEGIIGLTEKCNGSGDCRKLNGGTMCPSYRATREETDTTRGRANALREFLSNSKADNPFDHEELREVLDLCLSCKACTSECPSSVDMTTLKSEFLHQYYRSHRRPLRDYFFGHIDRVNALGSRFPALTNFVLGSPILAAGIKQLLGVATRRSLPRLSSSTFDRWYQREGRYLAPERPTGEVWLFCDEFTRYNDVSIGRAAVRLLTRLGYRVRYESHPISGRALFSKGFLKRGRRVARANVDFFSQRVSADRPLIGLEPSAILSFGDEYQRLVSPGQREKAKALSDHCHSLLSFLHREMEAGRIDPSAFTDEARQLYYHGHCHQKSLSDITPDLQLLSLPINYQVEYIPAGCCGMAGSFGYEKEHFGLSQQVGEETLFPALRAIAEDATVVAPGTSCRHQIRDASGRAVLHPVEVLWQALL